MHSTYNLCNHAIQQRRPYPARSLTHRVLTSRVWAKSNLRIFQRIIKNQLCQIELVAEMDRREWEMKKEKRNTWKRRTVSKTISVCENVSAKPASEQIEVAIVAAAVAHSQSSEFTQVCAYWPAITRVCANSTGCNWETGLNIMCTKGGKRECQTNVGEKI